MNRSLLAIIGFGLASLSALVVSQWVVINTLRNDMHANHNKAEEVNRLSIERHEQAEADSRARYMKAIEQQKIMLDEFAEWRRSLAKQNPEITVPKTKSEVKKK